MVKILGISGSLRARSFNTSLLKVAQSLSGTDFQLDAATLHGIPLYDADVEEKSGIPAAVAELKERFVASDGVLLVTPEYNNSIPGVFKNGIDWLSRPSEDISRVFRDRPMAIIGASPGNFGTILSQSAWLPVLRTLRARYWSGGRLMIPKAGTVFDEKGELRDEAIRKRLAEFLNGFAAFIRG